MNNNYAINKEQSQSSSSETKLVNAVVLAQFHKKSFFYLAICLSVAAASHLIHFLGGENNVKTFAALPALGMILSAISCWLIYLSKKDSISYTRVNRLSLVDAIPLFVLSSILILVAHGVFDAIKNPINPLLGDFFVKIIFNESNGLRPQILLTFAAVLAIIVFAVICHFKRYMFFRSLNKNTQTLPTRISKTPMIFSYALCAISVLACVLVAFPNGLGSTLGALAANGTDASTEPSLLNMFADFIKDLEENALGSPISKHISLLTQLALAVYFYLSGKWMAEAHREVALALSDPEKAREEFKEIIAKAEELEKENAVNNETVAVDSSSLTVEELSAKIEKGKESLKEIVNAQRRSPIFLATVLCFAIAFLSHVFGIATGGTAIFACGVIPAICLIITFFGLCKTYLTKKPQKLIKSFKRASSYDGYNKFIYSIWTTLAVLLCIALVILSVFILGSSSEIKGETLKLWQVIWTIEKVLLIVGIPTIIIGRLRDYYAQRRDYFKHLGSLMKTDSYDIESISTVGSYIIGGWFVLLGIASFSSSLLISGSISSIKEALELIKSIDFLKDVDLSFVLNNIQAFVAENSSSITLSGVSSLALGSYYILSGVWMNKTHAKLKKVNDVLIDDMEILSRKKAAQPEAEPSADQL